MPHSEEQRKSPFRSKLDLEEVLELLSNTADGVYATDPDGIILLWNQSAEEILGFQKEEVIGKRCYELLVGRDSAGNLLCFKGCAVLTMASRHQPIRNYNSEMMTKDRRKIWLNTSILLVSGRGWGSPMSVHLFRPISPPHRTGGQPLPMVPPSQTGADGKQPSARSPLTRREAEVLSLLGQGLAAKEIANHLNISSETARTHIQNILKRFQVHSKLEAVILAWQQGLLQG